MTSEQTCALALILIIVGITGAFLCGIPAYLEEVKERHG